MTAADGRFTLDGEAFAGGPESPVEGEGGRSYLLTLADGNWTVAFLPSEVMVDLGSSGISVTLATTEDGGWIRDGEEFASGTVVPGDPNAATGLANLYELTFADGTWTAAYRPVTVTITGTGIEARSREDGSGYDVGDDLLLASGVGEVSAPGGAMYRVAKDANGQLSGTRFDVPIVGRPLRVSVKGIGNPAPGLSADDRATEANEEGTLLEALGAEFAMADLLDSGLATDDGPNIVAQARDEIAKIRDYVARLVELYGGDGIGRSFLDDRIDEKWEDADAQLAKIFGTGTANRVGNSVSLEREASPNRAVDAFDRVIEALSSEEAFQAATEADSPDALQGFLERTAAQASAAFNRNQSIAEARFGALGATRFGAAAYNETDKAQSGFGDAERVQVFAWATMQSTRRSSDVQVSGYGYYSGETRAADAAGNLYSGTIDLEVRFARNAVDGLVRGLVDADTREPWAHGLGGEVNSITLPTASLNLTGAWRVTDRSESNRGRLTFARQAGGWPDRSLDMGSTFTGRLLGTGEASGSEAIGTWEVVAGNSTLAGGFGAKRGPDRASPGAAVTGDFATIGQTGNARAVLETGPAALSAVVEDAMTTPPITADDARVAIPASTVVNTGNARFKYDPPDSDDLMPFEYVDSAYEPQRATVLEADDYEETKGNWVSEARAEIAIRLSQLQRVIALDGVDASATDRTFANQQRQQLFNDIQAEIQKVFGPGRPEGAEHEVYTGVLTRHEGTLTATDRWTANGTSFHEDYPVNSAGVAQDAGVMAEIEDVLAAFADRDAFADEFGSGGLFADVNTATDQESGMLLDPYPSPSEMFERPRGQLRIVSSATDLTRFGAWSHQVSRNAGAALSAQTFERGDRGAEFGAFAYSPLNPTAAYASATSRLYPARGAASAVSATYAGETVAAQADLFYEGTVEATVYWDPATVTDSQISVTISDLAATETGESLQIGRYVVDNAGNVGPGIAGVGSLTWTADIETTDRVLKFSKSSGTIVRVSFNSLSGGFQPSYDHQLRLDFVRRSGGHYYQFGSDGDNYVRLQGPVGVGLGALRLTAVRQSGSTRNPNVADQSAFASGQESLTYPKWVMAGPRINTGTSLTNAVDTYVFIFADGSMLQYGPQDGTSVPYNNPPLTNRWRRAIGIDTAKNPASLYAIHVSGDPALSANNGEHLFTRPGSTNARGYPTAGSTDIALFSPSMTPSQLYNAYFDAGGYINVAADDAAALASELEGMFVGQDADGPLGIIGNWSLTGDAFGVGETRGTIRGAFGAEFQP